MESSRLPVFVFPSAISFFSDDQSSHKQIVTLYNPYDFHLRFKVLSTAPHKYVVVDSDGVIKSRCCVDIVIRHTEVSALNERVRDKFRIQVSEYQSHKLLGRKDVVATLLPTKEETLVADEKFEYLPPNTAASQPAVQQNIAGAQTVLTAATGTGGPNLVVIIAAVGCILALMLPNSGDDHSRLPTYLHMSLHQKLIAAYVLGLVTIVLLRT